MTKDKEKAVVLNGTWKVWRKEDLPLVEDDQVREALNSLGIDKSM